MISENKPYKKACIFMYDIVYNGNLSAYEVIPKFFIPRSYASV